MLGCYRNERRSTRRWRTLFRARARPSSARLGVLCATSATSMSGKAAPRMTAACILSFVCLVLGWLDPAALAQAQPRATRAPAPAGEGAAPKPGAEVLDTPQAVVPPGQEEILSDILGRGVALPGKCKFDGAEAAASVISSTYACPKGRVTFELRHPAQAAAGATTTAEFALVLKSGSPPAGLTEALVAHIRSREAAFKWLWVGASPTR